MFRLKEENLKRVPLLVGLMLLVVCLMAPPSWAVGTPAGTIISNTATVSYTVSVNPVPQTASATGSFTVLEVIDAVVTWQDAAAVAVNSPHTDAGLTFLLTNTGNGPESFQLTYDPALAGDGFDPIVTALWLETNTTPGLQTSGPMPDTLYINGTNDPLLAADGGQLIYLLSNIPAGLADASTGQVQLVAGSLTPGASGAAAGTVLTAAGVGGIDAIVGATNADGDATGTYQVTTVNVTLTKSVLQIVDTFGGSQPYPGAAVTYRIQVDVSGSGMAEGLAISDSIPADMTYVAGSMVLDGSPQTDADDAPVDNSDFNVTTVNAVTLNLGDIVAPATLIIDFEATIN